MYHVYLNQAAGVYLFFYFFNFLSLKFQNIKFFVTLFCEAYKVETWYTHGQRVDLLCTPNTSSQNILVPLFFFFFLSLQLAKIKNLHLQNCFSLPLMATARGMWALLTLCYICALGHPAFRAVLVSVNCIVVDLTWWLNTLKLGKIKQMKNWKKRFHHGHLSLSGDSLFSASLQHPPPPPNHTIKFLNI